MTDLVRRARQNAYGDKLVRAVVESDNRRLVDNDFVVMYDYGIGGAKVDCNFFCK